MPSEAGRWSGTHRRHAHSPYLNLDMLGAAQSQLRTLRPGKFIACSAGVAVFFMGVTKEHFDDTENSQKKSWTDFNINNLGALVLGPYSYRLDMRK